jgi:hypothetical protein
MVRRQTRRGGLCGRCVSWVCALALLAVFAPPAYAEEAQARAARAFADAERAFGAHEYGRAAALFEDAYSASPHPAALWNAARSRHLGGEMAAAANLFARFLRAAPASEDRDEAKATLSKIERLVGRLTVTAPPGAHVEVDGKRLDLGDAIYLEPGQHTVVATSVHGGPVRRTLRIVAASVASVDMTPPVSAPAVEDAARPKEREGHGLPPLFALVSGGATLVASGVAVWSGLDVLAQRRQWDRSGSNVDLDLGLEKQTRTNVLIGVAVGLAVVTTVVALLTDWRSPVTGRAVGMARPQLLPP